MTLKHCLNCYTAMPGDVGPTSADLRCMKNQSRSFPVVIRSELLEYLYLYSWAGYCTNHSVKRLQQPPAQVQQQCKALSATYWAALSALLLQLHFPDISPECTQPNPSQTAASRMITT